jgi:uncharacterized membrane protein
MTEAEIKETIAKLQAQMETAESVHEHMKIRNDITRLKWKLEAMEQRRRKKPDGYMNEYSGMILNKQIQP